MAGQEFLAFRPTLQNDPAQAEYQLQKILYFSNHAHSARARQLLANKQNHLDSVLAQLNTTRPILLSRPGLLVIAELLGSLPGAIQGLLNLSEGDLTALAQLGEAGFEQLCHAPNGLVRLCRKIGGEYTRAEERRLHQIMSMALLTIAQAVPAGSTMPLVVPPPYSNLLTAKDVFERHANYTTDLSVWSDGVGYQVSTSMTIIPLPGGALPLLMNATLQPQAGFPAGTGQAPANHGNRSPRRGGQKVQTRVINPLVSEAAEDYVEDTFLRPEYGANLVRAGHRRGEVLSLPDGIVPGADFYVIDPAGTPNEFIEVKSISGSPPAEVSLTRPEFLRARLCAQQGIPYRLILVDIATNQSYEVDDFVVQIAALTLDETTQFSIKIR
jgi:hypothetical protein